MLHPDQLQAINMESQWYLYSCQKAVESSLEYGLMGMSRVAESICTSDSQV